jgi:hypothetical protein
VHRLLTPFLLLTLLLRAVPGAAQSWLTETPTFAGGRITLGGECTVTVSPDDKGRFNLTDYERSALQLARLSLTASIRPIEGIVVVTELHAEGDTAGGEWTTTPYALYVRVRPWRNRPFDVQAGRIPPVFGTGGRRAYANDNVLIGYPLIWQYLTILRSDAIPGSVNELIYARYYGWQSSYSVGASDYGRGVPLATAFHYDTGVEARVGDDTSRVSVAGAITAGTLSSPGTNSRSGGPQFSTRVAFRPLVGLVIGTSYADGQFLAKSVRDQLPAAARDERYPQRTWGVDAEYSRGYWLLRGEAIGAHWSLPSVTTDYSQQIDLSSAGVSLEARYRLAPGLSVGARFDHLGFSTLRGSVVTLPWDAPVTRVEAGVAWTIVRHVTARMSIQHNERERGPVRRSTLPAAQVSLWF